MLKMMLGAALASAFVQTADAQAWPTRPVTMVVPFAAGGTTDVLGRIMAQRLGEILGQHVIIENVGGSGGMTGSLRVAQAPPDGSQILFSGLGPLVLNQARTYAFMLALVVACGVYVLLQYTDLGKALRSRKP